MWRRWLGGLVMLAWVGPGAAWVAVAQAPPVLGPVAPPPPSARDATGPESIKPLPLEPIPDDPPPHEGAMFEMTYRIEPPDLILVEVMEALPGRPITGERLVRPDGKISLGFYGDVHVAGLTVEQAKVKLILHLRRFLTDEALGLVHAQEVAGVPVPKPGEGDIVGGRGRDEPIGRGQPFVRKERDLFTLRIEGDPSNPDGGHSYSVRLSIPNRPSLPAVPAEKPAPPPDFLIPQAPGGVHDVRVKPAVSTAVFVDVSSYNSKVYYVQGDVANPGRLPCTGNETVFDVIVYAGGFLPSADANNVRLFRPDRGQKPAREYAINFRAIERGDRKSNLQVLPGDRLVIERKAGLQTR